MISCSAKHPALAALFDPEVPDSPVLEGRAITQEAYRGHGLAPIACAFLIEACGQRGLQAIWSCDADHQASIRVACKLGFREEREYRVLDYH